MLAETRGTEQEEIEAALLDIDAELDRLERPLLAERPVERLDLGRGLEAELFQIAALV